MLAPRRGLLWGWARDHAARRRMREEHLLKDLYASGEPAREWSAPVSIPTLMGIRGKGARTLELDASRRARAGFVERSRDGFKLTGAGVVAA